MYLLDDRYLTVVSFVDGCDVATDRTLLKGFNQWIADQILGHESNLHWSTIIASPHAPFLLEQVRTKTLPEEVMEAARDDLLEYLDQYLTREKQ